VMLRHARKHMLKTSSLNSYALFNACVIKLRRRAQSFALLS
jgi:hypothetical protein